ncbi:hypothetical protein QE412_002037 [Microbacterium trichothecenolyticum]|uniref:Uncharacterized protein n=1 Tax=Microbacterium trichothecenolyticum TaxID=69370 RepID=A0ABU0TUZ0_MICTR|nr:hypothetical protein [Microbacterium trichothecenolyticum]
MLKSLMPGDRFAFAIAPGRYGHGAVIRLD